MGTVYMGPFADAIGDHEGYPSQVLNDGTLTGTYSDETRPRMIGKIIAACDCGWTGQRRYDCPQPFDEDAENQALAEWEHEHLRPMVNAVAERHQVTALDLLNLARSMRKRATERHLSSDGRELAERGFGLCDAADEIDHFVEDVTSQDNSNR